MRGMKWKAIVAGMVAGAALLMAGCGGSSSGDAAKSANAAQNFKGKKLVMYVSFHEDTAKELSDAFKKKTGADVSFIRLPTGEALARIQAEKDSPKADVWLGGTADAHAKAASDGLLSAYKAPNAKMILPQLCLSAITKNVSKKNLNQRASRLLKHWMIF